MKYYTVKEVAEAIKMSDRTVYLLLKTKKMKGLQIGRSWRISEENLNDFIKNNSNK